MQLTGLANSSRFIYTPAQHGEHVIMYFKIMSIGKLFELFPKQNSFYLKWFGS